MFVTEENGTIDAQMQMLQAMIYYLVDAVGGSFVFDYADLNRFMSSGRTFMVGDVSGGFAIKVEKPKVELTGEEEQ